MRDERKDHVISLVPDPKLGSRLYRIDAMEPVHRSRVTQSHRNRLFTPLTLETTSHPLGKFNLLTFHG